MRLLLNYETAPNYHIRLEIGEEIVIDKDNGTFEFKSNPNKPLVLSEEEIEFILDLYREK